MSPYDIIYEIIYGSRAYGTDEPDSDIDRRGIFLPSVEDHLSLKGIKEIRYTEEENEVLFYPIQKFVSLAIKNNPSVLEWLFVSPKSQVLVTGPGQVLIDNKDMLLSKEIYHRFKGYAYSEFQTITKLTGTTGEKRRKQILEHGYSPKNAMNCIRLIEQAVEMLKDGTLTLPRPNASALLEIKHGEWTYDMVLRRFTKLLEELDEAHEASSLPDKVDFEYWDTLQTELILGF